jgi:hypothetical protein
MSGERNYQDREKVPENSECFSCRKPTLCAPIKSSPLYFSGSWRSCFRFCPENCEQLRTPDLGVFL